MSDANLSASEYGLSKESTVSVNLKPEGLVSQPGSHCCSSGLTSLNTIDSHASLIVTLMVDNWASPCDEIAHALITVAKTTGRIVDIAGPVNG